MDIDLREKRAAELRVLQHHNPRGLIEKYCELTGQPPSSQLPHGVSFSRMIDTILEREPQPEKSSIATN